MRLSFVKLFSVVSVVEQGGWGFQCDFQGHILIVSLGDLWLLNYSMYELIFLCEVYNAL